MSQSTSLPQPATPLSQQVAAQLRNLIFEERRFQPGDRIPDERSLARELGVSRASLREAIKTLLYRGQTQAPAGLVSGPADPGV